MKTKTIEEYIETIHALQKKHGHAHTNDVASVLGVAPPSATEMLQKLGKQKLVKYVPYRGATLTDKGERMARELLEKHRTLAEFLELIGVGQEDAEIDACKIEHHVSEDTINQLNKFLEFVRDAPHDPRWLAHFRHFCETGERLSCDKR
jgi:DtxR family Mn-dependent transcriptional regulator